MSGSSTPLLEVAKNAVALAQRSGAQEAIAATHRTREVEIGWRDGAIEKVSESTSRGLSLALYVDGRYSAVSTSDLRPEALASFVAESVVMARALAPDEHRTLPDPKLYEGRSNADLKSHDPAYRELTAAKRRELAEQLEEAARSLEGKGRIQSVSTSVSDSESESARVTSNGFEGERKSTSYWLGAQVTVLDPDGRRPDGSSFVGARFFGDLPEVRGVGREATQRAYDCIGAAKIPSLVCPLVVENRVSSRLVRALLGPLGGRALQQKQSFLEGKVGQSIASPLLSITDDPFIPKGFGSRHYDSDGISAKKFSVLEKGVLKSYYVDDYYGRKLGMAPTTSGPSNLVFGLGKKSLDELIAEVGDGILVTGFLGGNTNSITGDYSLGVQGFRIEKGKRTTPIGEMNISGNQLELWKKLRAVGNDPYAYSTMFTPSMVFDGVQFAGA